MNLIFCVALGSILSNTNVNSLSGVGLAETVKEFNEDDHETKLTDLNVDCMFLILDHLDYGDSLNVAQIDEIFSIFSAGTFRRKYSNLRVVIEDKFKLPANSDELLKIAGMNVEIDMYTFSKPPVVSKTQIELYDGNQILNTFKHFGHVIKKLQSKIYSFNGTLQVDLISKLINKYSSESLVDFEITFDATKLLERLKKPLKNVENLTFGICDLIFDSGKVAPIRAFGQKIFGNLLGNRIFNTRLLPPNEIFPAVRRWSLNHLTEKSLDYFDCNMAHLEHVSMKISGQEYENLNIFIKNPQIRSIDLFHSDHELLQKINTFLPQLEILKLSHFLGFWSGYIHFENVRTFYLGQFTNPANLHLPQIQMLQITDYNVLESDVYTKFLNEHNHLNHLHLTHKNMPASQFHQLTANLTDLVELTIESKIAKRPSETLSSVVLVEFLRSHSNVTQFNVINYPESLGVELQEHLKHEWNSRIHGAGLFFNML